MRVLVEKDVFRKLHREIKGMSVDELASLLDSGSITSASEREEVADIYLQKLFGENIKRLGDAVVPLISSVAQNGSLNKNDTLKFVKNTYLPNVKTSTPDLTSDILITIMNEVTNKNLSYSDAILKDSRLYDDGLYKVKAILFANKPRNLRDYGLFKKDQNGNPTKDYITTNDLLDKKSNEIENYLNSSQTKNFEDKITVSNYLENELGIDTENKDDLLGALSKYVSNDDREKLNQLVYSNPYKILSTRFEPAPNGSSERQKDAAVRKAINGVLAGSNMTSKVDDISGLLMNLGYKRQDAQKLAVSLYDAKDNTDEFVRKVLDAVGDNKR